MRFEVPQFIEIQDKIFGPFTWKQFIYLTGGGGFGVMLYLMGTPLILFVLIGLPIIGLALALAFYPVNNRPFSIFLESIVTYLLKKKLYLWRRRAGHTYTDEQTPAPVITTPTDTVVQKKDISKLSRALEMQALEQTSSALEDNDKIPS